ncbi:protein O-linked-mannose beta-1,2-N-acetylglucosaminyltransferase 1-like [Corticium candelabrum]|uniref:protein O-linked-mannose beta-1,2-N-acetylglucosaminyltransferase 1-like n=1 Tax=Corticium candelabrum TaxID=121492 RepID=UPI002E367A7C|nr:protein O-linked-mannose beta-1,2-N-acetylglucosaminyltransferase 1-like [Corticium candelabrum]
MSGKWKPNPNASPFVPRAPFESRQLAASVVDSSSWKRSRRTTYQKPWRTRVCQTFLLAILLLTLVVNVVFLLDASAQFRSTEGKLQNEAVRTASNEEGLSSERRRQVMGKQAAKERFVRREMRITLSSGKDLASIAVDGTNVIEATDGDKDRGMHVAVLHQATGSVMAVRHFDTYVDKGDDAMILFINMVSDGRILCMIVKDEGSFSLKKPARQLLTNLGSQYGNALGWRDMWAFVTQKRGSVYGEKISKNPTVTEWGESVTLEAIVPTQSVSESECNWPESEENDRRKVFCNKFEGYGSLCDCHNPSPIVIDPRPLMNNRVANVPVAVIASNRPFYLYRMLRSLFAAYGAPDKSMVTVFIDGFNEEPAAIAQIFGVQGIQHAPQSQKNGRISQHYKASLTSSFSLYPTAEYLIIIEEDLDVSLDFFSYFSQTLKLLEEDESVYCVSAWNDQGYDHSCKDSSLLYRVETMPGLGWILKRKMFEDELEPQWPTPDKLWDWDMWMRLPQVRKGRECIVPDVSRTYHFGSTGLNMNTYFQDAYFKKHSLNTQPDVQLRDVDSLKKEKYEGVIQNLLSSAEVLDHSKLPCNEDFVPDTTDKTYVFYILMNEATDYHMWMQVAKCFQLWDLDARGFHRGLWRFFMKSNHILVVGAPYSPYSVMKPSSVKPIYMEKKKDIE